MSDRMTPIRFGEIMQWILQEKEQQGSVFGVRNPYVHKGGMMSFLGEKLETPFGPAAGPHTQLAQNIIAAYVGGARFFELKTVQILDGEDLPVAKPCIDARDECYNVEWSTELRVPEAMEEYIKAWIAIKLIAKEFSLGSPDGFMFNMSVGYDLDGIKTPKIDSFIEGLRDASQTAVWQEAFSWIESHISAFKKVDSGYLKEISAHVCGSITLSTLHGCPPQEIERIASYLIETKHFNTFIKCNPTLLGYDFARKTVDSMGFDYIKFDDHHFKEDLQYSDAVPMLRRLQALADREGLSFGVKLTNTFPVDNPQDVMAGDEMYMSGRALFPLTAEAARRLSDEFEGKLRISWSGGADYMNICSLYSAGIWPITLATTLLKPGGYQRLKQLAAMLAAQGTAEFEGVDREALTKLAKESIEDEWYRKPVKPAASRKINKSVPLTSCFVAPCSEGCPINQDVPEYVALAGEGRYEEALRVILDKNPLPFITGTICSHRCMTKCTRNFYEESVNIRSVKLEAAENGINKVIAEIKASQPRSDSSVAIVGGGPAGLAAAYFLCRNGIKATVFDSGDKLGGVVRKIIPDFRIAAEAIDADVEIVRAMGAEFVLNSEQSSAAALKKQGYKYVIFANGAWKHGLLSLKKGTPLEVFDFLSEFKKSAENTVLGENVVVIGGGNTAMDAARAAKRVNGVKNVSLVYRRTKRYMPADAEELELAVRDGVDFKELLAPLSHENGLLCCAKVVLGSADASGRRIPITTDEIVEIPADVVISAVGESADSSVFTDNGIAVDSKGRVVVSDVLLSDAEGVYVAGDARRGPATVVEAIADARTIADNIAKAEGLTPYSADIVKVCQAEDVFAKKGVLSFASEAECESVRCLECSTVCENCVDVCPNRANVSVDVPGFGLQIIHVDIMCNECGNCMTFCPWDSAPYKDKFTIFANERDFCDSENSGFVALEDGRFTVRLEGRVFTVGADCAELPGDLSSLIKAAQAQIPLGR